MIISLEYWGISEAGNLFGFVNWFSNFIFELFRLFFWNGTSLWNSFCNSFANAFSNSNWELLNFRGNCLRNFQKNIQRNLQKNAEEIPKLYSEGIAGGILKTLAWDISEWLAEEIPSWSATKPSCEFFDENKIIYRKIFQRNFHRILRKQNGWGTIQVSKELPKYFSK